MLTLGLILLFVALVVGLIWAALKAAPVRLISWPAAFVTEFLRDTPLLVQLFFLYYVLPEFGIVLPAFMTGALALGVQYSAYTSQVYRAGIEAVSGGQVEAARSLGLSNWQFGRLFGRGGVLSGDSVFTIRTRVVQSDPDIGR